MSKVKRSQEFYDDDLLTRGLRRAYRSEYVQCSHGLAAIYREIVIADVQQNLTPWWKLKKATRGKKS